MIPPTGTSKSFIYLFLPLITLCVTITSAGTCPQYVLWSISKYTNSLEADLRLDGIPCQRDAVASLKLVVQYQEIDRIHVHITDKDSQRYEVPTTVFPRPSFKNDSDIELSSLLAFTYETSPFSFTISRRLDHEVLFSTKSIPLLYTSNHLQISSILPPNPNIYGLGETTDAFRTPVHGNGTMRTLWARDAYGTPNGTNLYGAHPIYFEHRATSTHGVFLLNSNGMDITIQDKLIKYDILGGVLDFYFLAGPSPVDVAQQYARLAGLPAMAPYWSLGFQQCRYGYKDYVQVAQVVANYSTAGIPLETMWTDIDYMYQRRVFTLDDQYFPLVRMREFVEYLHAHHQRYVMMVDPAVAYQPNDQGAFDRGAKADIFLKEKDGTYHKGVVWPGVTVYPDWFHPAAQAYWTGEITKFFDPKTVNEPANFAIPCPYPCDNTTLTPEAQAIASGNPPKRTTRPPATSLSDANWLHRTFHPGQKTPRSLPELREEPPYQIHNAAGELDKGTIRTDLVHYNGLKEWDVHNIYGTSMSLATYNSMLSRRPKVRTQVITRSTFAGAGRYAGHWTGDNLSDWSHYLSSISQMLSFAALFQMPLVGSDVCGFGSNTTEELCARWASLGAFYPFYRNHNEANMISQEFYQWKSVSASAKNAIRIRYSLLDYFYTHLKRQSSTGEPAIKPLWFIYPTDPQTFDIDTQFFFGDSILVSPVLGPNSTSVNAYFPESGHVVINNEHGHKQLEDILIYKIPVHIRPGSILPLRKVVLTQAGTLAHTTTRVRKCNFQILVALDEHSNAQGSLYLDDGESIEVKDDYSANLTFKFSENTLDVSGRMGSQIHQIINSNVHEWKFIGVKNINNLKDVYVTGISSESTNIIKQLDTNTVIVQGRWKLTAGINIQLVY